MVVGIFQKIRKGGRIRKIQKRGGVIDIIWRDGPAWCFCLKHRKLWWEGAQFGWWIFRFPTCEECVMSYHNKMKNG